MRRARPSARVTSSEERSLDRRPVRVVPAGGTANEAAGAPFATTASGIPAVRSAGTANGVTNIR
jgi:hypothetical protein